MRLSAKLGRSFRFEEIPVNDLPATVTRTAGRGHALFITIFAVVSGGFPVVALFAVGGEINWDLIWIVALFPLVSAGILVYGLHQLLWRKTVTLRPDRVEVEQRGLFGSKSWEEPLSAYEGVAARTKRVSRSSRQGASSYTVYMVELHHGDDARNVTLYASRDESEWRRKWEAAARRLGLKALEDSEDGLLERAPEDLDKSVAELIEEGKVAVDYDLLQHKAAGIALDMDGNTVVVTRQRPQNTLVGALIFLAFPLVFIWVGFYSDAPVPINWLFGGLGLLFEALILLGVAWDLLSRRRLRIGPQRIRVCSVSRWGETKGKSLAVADIETVKLGREDGRSASPGLMLAGDQGKLNFGRRLPDDTLEFLRNLVLAKIEKHHVRS